jgi:type IV pilus assembly protein PilM
MPRAVWGLDIGFSSIKAVQMERMGSVAEVTSFDVIEIEPSDDDSTRPGRVQAALNELVGRRRIANDPVFVAVPGNQTFFRPFSLPAAPPSRLPGIVSFEARNQIPFPINEVLWDYKPIAEGEGGETRVGLVAVRRELIDELLGQIRTLGLQLEGVQVAPLALYNLVSHEFGVGQNWLVLDAGARVTDFVIVDGEEFWFRPLPQSGNDFTRALEQKFRMTFEEADTLKLKMGDSKQAQKLFQVIEPMLRNLVGDIQRTVGYYKGLRPQWDVERILAVGNSFRLPGLLDFLQQTLDVDVVTYDQMRRIRLGVGVDVDWWKDEVASMGVAMGLGLQGLGLAEVTMEFLPESVLKARMIRRKRPWVAAAVGVAVLASAASFFAARAENRMLERDLTRIERRMANVRTAKTKCKAERSDIPGMEAEVRDWAENTVTERAWMIETLETIGSLRTDGKPALGKDAGSDGVYVTYMKISRDDPFDRDGPKADRDIEQWYEEMEKAAGTKPLVAYMQVEVAGPEGTSGRVMPAETDHVLKSLKGAVEFASRIYEVGRERPLVGRIVRTPEQREQALVSVEFHDGSKREDLNLKKDVKRLFWFRNLKVTNNWDEAEKILVPESKIQPLQSEGKPVPARQVLVFRLAWIIDDGSLELPAE